MNLRKQKKNFSVGGWKQHQVLDAWHHSLPQSGAMLVASMEA
jgi:hypothetical protein